MLAVQPLQTALALAIRAMPEQPTTRIHRTANQVREVVGRRRARFRAEAAPAPSNSTYQMLMQRGRSLSQPGASGSSVGINSPDANAVDPRLTKDPIGSYGYGSTPTRNPLSSGPTSYSFQSPSGPSTQGLDSRPSGQGLGLSGTLDTIQHYTPQSMPKLQRGLGNNSYAAPINSSDPSSRTYDPNQQPSNSYDPNRR